MQTAAFVQKYNFFLVVEIDVFISAKGFMSQYRRHWVQSWFNAACKHSLWISRERVSR